MNEALNSSPVGTIPGGATQTAPELTPDADGPRPVVSLVINLFGWAALVGGIISAIALWPESRPYGGHTPSEFYLPALGVLLGSIFACASLVGFATIIELLNAIRWQLLTPAQRKREWARVAAAAQPEPRRLGGYGTGARDIAEASLKKPEM